MKDDRDREWLGRSFEQQRPRLRAIAYRMLGSVAEAEDAVQEAWLRLSAAGDEVHDLGAWLTTVVGRVALNMLRSRKLRSETQALDPIIDRIDRIDGPTPEQGALLADTVGLAMLVVLETLTPAERVAFVLHDVFAIPFEAIAPIVERTPEAARQLASRARRRVQARGTTSDADLRVQRAVVDAFRAAAEAGDFERLVAVLDPEVVLRVDVAPEGLELRGAENVARQARSFSRRGLARELALVNGAPGIVSTIDGKPFSVLAFTVRAGKITEIDILQDPERMRGIDWSALA